MTTEDAPIYIIGNTPLAFYLAGKLSAIEDVRLLASGLPEGLNNITIKDEVSLQKYLIPLRAENIMHDTARLVIICSSLQKIKSDLLYLSKAKTDTCPILVFGFIDNEKIINDLLPHPFIQAHFDGWFKNNKQNETTFFGATKGLTICEDEQTSQAQFLKFLFDQIDLKISFTPNKEQSFWNYFIPYAAETLFSLHNKISLKDISKKAIYRQEINDIFDELMLCAAQNFQTEKEQLINNLYQIPLSIHPILQLSKRAQLEEINYINNVIHKQPIYKPATAPVITDIIHKLSSLFFCGEITSSH